MGLQEHLMIWATCALLMAPRNTISTWTFEVSPRQQLRNMVLIGKLFFTLDNYPKHIALDTRYWMLCNTPPGCKHRYNHRLSIRSQAKAIWRNIWRKNGWRSPRNNIKTSQITHNTIKRNHKEKRRFHSVFKDGRRITEIILSLCSWILVWCEIIHILFYLYIFFFWKE